MTPKTIFLYYATLLTSFACISLLVFSLMTTGEAKFSAQMMALLSLAAVLGLIFVQYFSVSEMLNIKIRTEVENEKPI